MCFSSAGLQRVRHNLVAEQQQSVIEEELGSQILMLMSEPVLARME